MSPKRDARPASHAAHAPAADQPNARTVVGREAGAGAADNCRSTNQAGKPPAEAAREQDFKNERRDKVKNLACINNFFHGFFKSPGELCPLPAYSIASAMASPICDVLTLRTLVAAGLKMSPAGSRRK